MRLHLLPFGAPSWERRKAIFKEIITALPGPPYDFRGVVYLAPNERMVRMMRVLFLEALEEAAGSKGCIPPVFHALNRFISTRVRQATKARVAEGLERELVIEELCRKVARRMPELESRKEVDLSLAPLVCDALDKGYTFGADDRRLREFARDSLPLGFLMEVKGAYEAWLERHGFADMAAARAAYRPKPTDFDFSAVVLDGFYDADPVETRVLKALSQAPESHLIVQVPGLSLDGSATEGSPYFGTAAMIKELYEDTVTGDSFGTDNAEAEVLAGALFEGVPVRKSYEAIKALGEKRRDVMVAGALNPAEEVYFIAREIKESYLAGNGPALGNILVFPVTPGAYLPLIREAFTDYGIPFHISQGTPLAHSPVVASFLDILSMPVERYSFRAMRRVFASPFVRLAPGGNRLDAFDAFARSEGITGGRQRWVKATEGIGSYNGDTAFVHPLKRLLLLADSSSGNKTIDTWAGECLTLLIDAGFTDAVGEYRDKAPETWAAYEALVNELVRLKEHPALMAGGIDGIRFQRVIKKLLSDKSYSTNDGTVSGVRVLGRQEILSEPFDAIYVCGISDGSLPAPVRRDIFFTGDTAAALGIPSSRQSLTRDARLFLALLLSANKVVLTWPENSGRGPASPSPYVTALEPFIRAGYVKERERVNRPSTPDEALGSDELLRTLTLFASRPGVSGLLEEASRKIPALARIVENPGGEQAPSFSAPGKRRFSVTELEEYILCRYRYYQARVLKSAQIEEPDDDIAPHEAGSIVHEILRDFYRQMGKEGLKDSASALEALRKLAETRFNKLPKTFANSELKRRFIEKVAPRFIETEAALSDSSFHVSGTEDKVEAEIPDGEGGTITLTGKIDRIEMDADGNIIVADYKTGKYPTSLTKQFQLPVYAYMLKDKEGAKRPAGFVYYNLRDGRMRDVVCYDKELLPGSAKGRRGKSPEEIEDMIARCVGEAVSAAKGIIAGEFSPNCEDAFVCRSCSYIEVCRKGELKAEDEGGESEEDEAK